MKLTDPRRSDFTSFHDVTIKTTVNNLVKALGEPQYFDNMGDDKVNVEWVCETKDEDVVTIYDWKEYREIDPDEEIEFHLGGHRSIHTLDAKDELIQLLYLLKQ